MQLRKFFKSTVVMSIAGLLLYGPVRAQAFENAGDYMAYIGKASDDLTTMYLTYLTAVGHNKSARKVEKRRQEVVNAIFNTRTSIQGMPPWKGDRTYRDSTVVYLKLLYSVFNEDYGKIVNMEEIAEQSYDAMEAYMMAQQKAGEKLAHAGDVQQKVQKDFAAKYEIKLLANTSELDAKNKQASALMQHYGDVYLAFYKPYKQEAYLIDAISKKDLTAAEQNISALKNTSEEALEKLKKLNGYNNDPTLILACQAVMKFYKEESALMNVASDFLLKEAAFIKLKKNFDSKPASQRTQKDIDEFNKGVNDINTASNAFNNTSNALNKQRTKVLGNWDSAVKNYLDLYMPVQRK
jgi:chemotaxis protein histidine kinase CheA